MRSGIRLATIRDEVMIEAGLSLQAGHAIYTTSKLDQMINRTERMMRLKEEWPDQQVEERVTIPADAQYVDLPATITFTEIESSHCSYGDEWLPINHGIGARERTIYNDSQRAMPIQKYEISATRPTQFEVWPVGSADQTILFQGTKTVGAMIAEDDICALDADVIVMRVAAQILGRDNQADAQLLLKDAQDHVDMLMKKQGAVKRGAFNLGRGKTRSLRPGIDYIAPGSG